jgi:perosamine synthetase
MRRRRSGPGATVVRSAGTGCFSFFATKNVTTGEGGVVTTDLDEVAETVRVLRNQGQRERYRYDRPGFNFRMTELQAALGVAQMERLPDIVHARRRNAAFLSAGLAGIEGLELPSDPPDSRHVFHQYTVRVTQRARLDRDRLHALLAETGIACGVYYPAPVFDHECFRADPRVGNPVMPMAERASREVLSIPVHPKLSDADLERIVAAVRELLT